MYHFVHARVSLHPFATKNSIIRNLMGKISLYVWGLGWGCGWWVGGLYVHTLVKNLLIKFLMMLFLVAKGCKFDSCFVSYSSENESESLSTDQSPILDMTPFLLQLLTDFQCPAPEFSVGFYTIIHLGYFCLALA